MSFALAALVSLQLPALAMGNTETETELILLRTARIIVNQANLDSFRAENPESAASLDAILDPILNGSRKSTFDLDFLDSGLSDGEFNVSSAANGFALSFAPDQNFNSTFNKLVPSKKKTSTRGVTVNLSSGENQVVLEMDVTARRKGRLAGLLNSTAIFKNSFLRIVVKSKQKEVQVETELNGRITITSNRNRGLNQFKKTEGLLLENENFVSDLSVRNLSDDNNNTTIALFAFRNNENNKNPAFRISLELDAGQLSEGTNTINSGFGEFSILGGFLINEIQERYFMSNVSANVTVSGDQIEITNLTATLNELQSPGVDDTSNALNAGSLRFENISFTADNRSISSQDRSLSGTLTLTASEGNLPGLSTNTTGINVNGTLPANSDIANLTETNPAASEAFVLNMRTNKLIKSNAGFNQGTRVFDLKDTVLSMGSTQVASRDQGMQFFNFFGGLPPNQITGSFRLNRLDSTGTILVDYDLNLF